jgi:glycosyltransferase involved in cell wall biosynthesis
VTAPEVLVVLPIYNAARYVTRAVESVLSQTFADFRLLALDDGSTDDSVAMVQRFGDLRVCLERRPHSGLAATVNRGLEQAQHADIPFVARMDADDMSEPTRLERQLAMLQAHPEAAACGCNCLYVDDDDRVIGSSTVPLSSRRIHWELNHGLRGLVHGATLFRTAALAAVGGVRLDFPHAEDVDLFLRLSERYQLINMPEFLYRIRLNPESLSVANARRNMLFALYAIDCAQQRAEARTERSFEDFAATLSAGSRLALWREERVVSLWRQSLGGNRWSRVLAGVIDPRRVLARIRRHLEQ